MISTTGFTDYLFDGYVFRLRLDVFLLRLYLYVFLLRLYVYTFYQG
jgi:hypothetical protein